MLGSSMIWCSNDKWCAKCDRCNKEVWDDGWNDIDSLKDDLLAAGWCFTNITQTAKLNDASTKMSTGFYEFCPKCSGKKYKIKIWC